MPATPSGASRRGSFQMFEAGSGSNVTMRENRRAFEEVLIRRTAVFHRERELGTTVLGHEISMPVIVSSVGFLKTGHQDGEADLARAAGLSRAHFSREFRAAFGESPHEYLLTRRMERAAALLRTTDRSVADVCLSVGLQSIGSFTTTFKRTYGVTPTAYRAAYPPAAARAMLPACVVRFFGRPQHSTNGEDSLSVRA